MPLVVLQHLVLYSQNRLIARKILTVSMFSEDEMNERKKKKKTEIKASLKHRNCTNLKG